MNAKIKSFPICLNPIHSWFSFRGKFSLSREVPACPQLLLKEYLLLLQRKGAVSFLLFWQIVTYSQMLFIHSFSLTLLTDFLEFIKFVLQDLAQFMGILDACINGILKPDIVLEKRKSCDSCKGAKKNIAKAGRKCLQQNYLTLMNYQRRNLAMTQLTSVHWQRYPELCPCNSRCCPAYSLMLWYYTFQKYNISGHYYLDYIMWPFLPYKIFDF